MSVRTREGCVSRVQCTQIRSHSRSPGELALSHVEVPCSSTAFLVSSCPRRSWSRCFASSARATTPRSPWLRAPAPWWSPPSGRATPSPACSWSPAKRPQAARLARLRHGWVRTWWLAIPSDATAPGPRPPRTMRPSGLAAKPFLASRLARSASWWRAPTRSCAACRPRARATSRRAPSPWPTRFPLTRSRPCSWAWATPTRVRWTPRAPSTCTATPSTSFPPRPPLRCALSSLATRSTACAAWSPRRVRP